MSVFLEGPFSDWVASNEHAFAVRDRYPVSRGHTLVITRRVVSDWFAATDEERAALFSLVHEVKGSLDAELHPDGYNIGFNVGRAAGQTVMHLHVHVIPRFDGDMDDPAGGVRYAIPSRGNYLRSPPPLATGGEGDPFARHIFPLFHRAQEIAILAAFVQESGLARIRSALLAALERGARVRLLTGDYLDITQADALQTMLDWQQASAIEDEGASVRRFEARVVEVAGLPGWTRSFHPKSWRFESKAERFGIAFVGSSNLSRSALDTGIEWNLRVDRDRDAAAYDRVRDAFDETWGSARPLDAAWVDAYARRARSAVHPLPPGESEADAAEPVPNPHAVQREALEALRASRESGRRRALVVLATGLGKTWLAAFDYRQLREEMGARPRLLFLAHRRELLLQAAATYRCLLREIDPGARIGWFTQDGSELLADLVFASIAKLARRENLERLRAERFDYVVVDEVHHAAADSYRRILDAIDPRFLLGLTATPDRADAADVLGLFDDFLAYRADVPRGIALGRLTPFHYFGVKDDIDYENIPWRNRQFDPEALAAAVQTEARMETLWRVWQARPGLRSLVFCCSIAHAEFVKRWLCGRGVKAAAVYASEGSDDRDEALSLLTRGQIDALCAVDLFNEGVDVPSIDRVVLLRPTESSVVFLQQLGRGLRAAEGKTGVTVLDLVGNHRVFLERVRTLLSLGGGSSTADLLAFLTSPESGTLPEGCSVELELEAKELLARLFHAGGADEIERVYRERRLERGERPRAGELQRMGYLPSRLRERHGSWFDFVRSEGDLTDDEAHVTEIASAFLREIETTEMAKCFKMVALAAVLDADALLTGLSLQEIALRSHALLRRSPELFVDISESERAEELSPTQTSRWISYWRKNPIEAWTRAKRERRSWFLLEGDRFVLDLTVDPALHEAMGSLTRELVDYRLAQYRARRRQGDASTEGFTCKLTWNQHDPILKLPSRAAAGVPEGDTDVRLVDGSVWQFRFAKEFCNVARPAGVARNQLPDLLRRWFGPGAGKPGTAFEVRFHAGPDGLWVEPVKAAVSELPVRRGVPAYPDLRAAAGPAYGEIESPDHERVWLPVDGEDESSFAVRVAGTSMDGGWSPLRDGDWAVMRFARGAPGLALVDRIVLVQVPGETAGSVYQIKRLRLTDKGWLLTSDNPAGPTIHPDEGMTVIARFERAFRPEELAPAEGTVMDDAELPTRFGLESVVPRSGRQHGHLFVFLEEKGALSEPDRLVYQPVPERPAETAFVLARRDPTSWRYVGVARWLGGGEWRLPCVDFTTWRAWGTGRTASRRLPEGALDEARRTIRSLLNLPEASRGLEQSNGRRARVVGLAKGGGLRIVGESGGMQERSVTLQDLAWVIVAAAQVREHGGVLDEERVHRARYLEGTPKGSTRWIDTLWALAAYRCQAGSGLLGAADRRGD